MFTSGFNNKTKTTIVDVTTIPKIVNIENEHINVGLDTLFDTERIT